MNKEQQQAYNWAINQSYPSVAATYAKTLAGAITRLEAERKLLLDASEKVWPFMFADMPKKINLKRSTYEGFYDVLRTIIELEQS